jgi:sec-independent protein translocase protein TatA
MPSIGPLEIAVILIIALLVLGPKKLPEMGRSVGRGMREFKRAVSMDDDEDERDRRRRERERDELRSGA